MKQTRLNWQPHTCEKCGQTTEYLLPLDRGTAEIVVAFAAAIRFKGVNLIHPRREMEGRGLFRDGVLTSNQVGNLSRSHRHGLIAKVKSRPGFWCLTTKGANFLNGWLVNKYAVISKVTGHQVGYAGDITTTVRECLGAGERWEGIDFEVENGAIVPKREAVKQEKLI